MITLQALCFGILGYLLGATPYGLIIARVFCHTDPRTGGSHNTGATNVARMCGFGWGVATLACDLLKGALPVFLAQMETGSPVVVTVAALSAVPVVVSRICQHQRAVPQPFASETRRPYPAGVRTVQSVPRRNAQRRASG